MGHNSLILMEKVCKRVYNKLENKAVEKIERKVVELLQFLNSNIRDIGSNDKVKS